MTMNPDESTALKSASHGFTSKRSTILAFVAFLIIALIVYGTSDGSSGSFLRMVQLMQHFSTTPVASPHLSSPPMHSPAPIDPLLSVTPRNASGKPRILLWTTFFGRTDFGVGLGDAVYRKHQCPSICENTLDRAEWASSDAIVFHVRDPFLPFPPGRPRHQKWVFYMLESPVYSMISHLVLDGMFNWTMTYQRSSDVQIPYGGFRERHGPLNDTHPLPAERPKLAAWLVSHCLTESRRELLYYKLVRLLNITKYGSCGGERCEKDDNACYRELVRDHLFYLSWENSLCEDYITEKLWKTLAFGAVPVVYGGAAYDQLLPPHSFIDVMQFNSSQELTSHLQYLSRNLTAYDEYRQWRRNFTIVFDTLERGWCSLCQKLYEERKNRTETRVRISEFWSIDDRCSSRNADGERVLGM